jgi:hypothetical protein
MTATYRLVQWTTGNVARETVRAVLVRPDLELVVCAALPGIRTYADLPPVTAHVP